MDADLPEIPKGLHLGRLGTMDTLNPFNITKAVDLTDDEIARYWVDISEGEGFTGLVKPSSAMPMLILGGKGSGKTHVMRYFSYPLQKMRHQDDVAHGIRTDGYLGIYFRCGGLNAARFSGKGQRSDVWDDVFQYYMELWVAQLLLSTVGDVLPSSGAPLPPQQSIYAGARELFDDPPSPFPRSLRALGATLKDLQRELDGAVNNCGITQELDARIRVTRGRLIFGLPQLLGRDVPMLEGVQYVYLVDEFENLSESQQRYVNTLLREKEIPCTFKIGARLYGVKTYGTYSADEENKEGSEFEALHLDDILRRNRGYPDFARELCTRRLRAAGYLSRTEEGASQGDGLDGCFVTFERGPFAEPETNEIVQKYEGRERPHFVALRAKLARADTDCTAHLRDDPDAVNGIVDALKCPSYPLLERLNIFLLYREWYRGHDLEEAAEAIRRQCSAHVKDARAPSHYGDVLSHFRGDLLAQLLRACDLKQRYLGFQTFVDMSDGLPRNLLITLKHIFRWATFNGEDPFRQFPISTGAQQAGVREASEWFFRDARVAGTDGASIRNSVERLAQLFREIRYSDKPTECSLCTFSAEMAAASHEAQRIVELAEKWSLLISVAGGQRDKNTGRVDVKYQLNPMLAPRWDLPVSRRGAIALAPKEADAIFDERQGAVFKVVLRQRVGPMMAPHFGRPTRRQGGHGQSRLLEPDSD